jgi:GTP-binding protein
VSLDIGQTFVVADIPGLIEGAHLGHGLGVQFLRHIERTRLLLHVVDMSGMDEKDPVDQIHTIDTELKEHNPHLLEKPRIFVASKMDAAVPERVRRLEQWCGQNNQHLVKISSITGEGLEELKRTVFMKLSSVDEVTHGS